ncbi:ZIP family metal transporter [Bacteroidota bacterium]
MIILFLSAILGGFAYFVFPKFDQKQFSNILIFAGSYLFAITIIHILPEVYNVYPYFARIGGFVIIGFFLQLLLESFSSGVEHGHIHKNSNFKKSGGGFSPWMLLIGLCLHSFLEGTIVTNPSEDPGHHHAEGIMFGIIIHKIPAAFALVTFLIYYTGNKSISFIYLTIFALASPLGLATSEWLIHQNLISDQSKAILFAIVSGSFLHISTTIFFESNPGHRFSLLKALISLAGVGLAVLVELFM